MKLNTMALWVMRKAVYVTVGSALGAGLAYVANRPDLNSWTLAAATSALGTALVGDLRRAFAPDFLQVLTGQDPRKDG